MRRARSVCWACAESGHVTAAPPTAKMNSRRFIGNPPRCSQPERKRFFGTVQADGCPSWVKLGNARSEPMFSALPPTTDIERPLRHVRFVPATDSRAAAKSQLFEHLIGTQYD